MRRAKGSSLGRIKTALAGLRKHRGTLEGQAIAIYRQLDEINAILDAGRSEWYCWLATSAKRNASHLRE